MFFENCLFLPALFTLFVFATLTLTWIEKLSETILLLNSGSQPLAPGPMSGRGSLLPSLKQTLIALH